jgi:hypothetical protein
MKRNLLTSLIVNDAKIDIRGPHSHESVYEHPGPAEEGEDMEQIDSSVPL